MYASKIIPFNPKTNATGFDQSIKIFAIETPSIVMFATNQITIPAGIAKTIARHKTKTVRSTKEV